MATRIHRSLNVVLEFAVRDPEKNETVFKKVTLSKINPALTDAQLDEVSAKIADLTKYPHSGTYLVTHQILAS